MTGSTTARRLGAVTLAASVLAALTAGPASARPSTFKPKLGTYKGREAAGQKFTLVIGPCDPDRTGGPTCLYTPDRGGSLGDVEFLCEGLDGAPDGEDVFESVGPLRVRSATVKTKRTETDATGAKTTLSYAFTLSAKGVITGTARLTATFTDGARCDTGVVKLNAKR